MEEGQENPDRGLMSRSPRAAVSTAQIMVPLKATMADAGDCGYRAIRASGDG
ncbi:hypothetical protein [Actinoplanes octamycinicus]|nr:hypothetical protein [Actinoplanes octamycinicus]